MRKQVPLNLELMAELKEIVCESNGMAR